MGDFGGSRIADIDASVLGVGDGTHLCVVSDATVSMNADKTKTSLVIEYTVSDPDDTDSGEKIKEYKQIPDDEDISKAADKLRYYLKTRIESLGVDPASGECADLIGKECKVTTQVRNNFVQVRNVVLDDGEDTSNWSSSLTV